MRTRLGLALAAVALAATTSTAEPDPHERYLLHCSGCHGPDGRGAPGVTPSLHGLSRLLEAPGGRAYLAAVPGVAQAPVDDAALAALLNWVIAEFSGGTRASPYTAKEMGELRAAPLRDPAAARPQVLTAM